MRGAKASLGGLVLATALMACGGSDTSSRPEDDFSPKDDDDDSPVAGAGGVGNTGGLGGGPATDGGVPATADAAAGDAAMTGGEDDAGSPGRDGGPSASPKRVVFFYTPHGVTLRRWKPTGGETDFQLPSISAPLAAIRSKIIIVDGIRLMASATVPGQAHYSAMSALLTGKTVRDPSSAGNPPLMRAAGPSLDVVLGALTSTAHRTVLLSVDTPVVNDASRTSPLWLSHASDGRPLVPVRDPREALSKYLDSKPAALAADVAQTPPLEDDASIPRLAELQRRIAVATLAEGRTQVVSYMLGHVEWLATLPVAPRTRFHELMHSGDEERMVAVQTWFTTQFVELVNLLESTRDQNGESLLANTLVVWMSETGEAMNHNNVDLPVVLAGNLGGYFRTGRFVKVERRNHVDLLATIAHAFGATTFSPDPALLTGLLAELR